MRRSARRAVSLVASAAGLVVLSLTAILLVMALWPTDQVDVLGVDVGVGAQRPGPGFGVSGPGQLETFGQIVDIRAIHVVGPVRPYLETRIAPYEMIRIATTDGAGAQAGDALVQAFGRWALWRTPAVLLTGAALLVAAAAVLSLLGRLPSPVHDHRRRYASWLGTGMVGVTLVWVASLGSAALGSQSIAEVTAIEDVFDYDVLRTSPPPAGAPRDGYQVVVLGDSRAAVLGGAPTRASTSDDAACRRSRDSLSEQLEHLLAEPGWRALNLSCASATVEQGLLQDQFAGGREIPAQVGALKRVQEPEVVVVSVGPNDVSWGPIVGSCYVSSCNVTGLSPTVNNALAEFDRSYDDLLADLAELEADPQVVVIGAYEPFAVDASCPDTRLPDGLGSLTPSELATISGWRQRLNAILDDGARARGFTYVEPRFVPLCVPDSTGLGADIWPLESEYRFHPTGLGVLKTALAVVAAIDSERLEADPSGAADRPLGDPTGQNAAPPNR